MFYISLYRERKKFCFKLHLELWGLACNFLLWSLNGPAKLMEVIILENSISKPLAILFCRYKFKYNFNDSGSSYWLVLP